MREVKCVEVETGDLIAKMKGPVFACLTDEALMAASMAEVVLYRGQVIKNRHGPITKCAEVSWPNGLALARAGAETSTEATNTQK